MIILIMKHLIMMKVMCRFKNKDLEKENNNLKENI